MMRKGLKITVWIAGSAAALVAMLILGVLVAGNSEAGRGMIERITYGVTRGMVKLTGLGGSFPMRLTLRHLEIKDRQGVWLSADAIALTWSPLALLERRISVDDLDVAQVDMERTPQSEGGAGGPPSIPHIDVQRFSVREVRLGAALAGTAARLSLAGDLELRSLEDARADVVAHRLDGDGEYAANLRFDPRRMDGTLSLHEPASGPLENILQLPGLGALRANLSLAGPREAVRVDLALSAGELAAKVSGSIDLRHGSTDLAYSIDAPAVSPRPDLKWHRLSLQGHWRGAFKDPTGAGQLQVDGLELPANASIATLRATLAGRQGVISVQGTVGGLRIPGPQPGLFQEQPIRLEASMRLMDDSRPLTVKATHPLLSLKAQAATAGKKQTLALEVQVPNVAPFAAMARQQLRGSADIKSQLDFGQSGMGVTLQAVAGPWEGAAWTVLLGPRATLELSGSVSEKTFSLRSAALSGRSFAFSASGTAGRPQPPAPGAAAKPPKSTLEAYVRDIQARWNVRLSDLTLLAPELAGSLLGEGTLGGSAGSFKVDASLKSRLSIRGSPSGPLFALVHAQGIPSAPDANLALVGTVDGSALTLTAALERSGRTALHATIRRGEWKSIHAQGDISLVSGIDDARGHLRVEIGQLSDFDRLLGTQLEGSLTGTAEFTPRAGRSHASFQLDGKDLVAGPLSGTVHMAGEGDTSSVAARLHLQSPSLRGYPAELTASAIMDLDTREVRAEKASMDYRGLKVELATPATLSYAQGLRIDQLKLVAQDAVLELDGRILPTLDAHLSLEHVGPKLLDVLYPDMVAQAKIEGHADLEGSLAAPTGRIRLAASGIRFAGEQALGLPALELKAGADLSGNSAALDVHLNAGGASVFTMTGNAPLNPEGAYDLKLNGKLDLAVANPLFEARGMQVGGNAAVDASVAGKLEAPQITGSVTLTAGNFRDYVHGTNLTNISAEVDGNQGALQIKTFTATAASGSLRASGTIGALQPRIPVNIKLTASKAQLLSSSIVTANVNADLGVTGTALERLDVAGSIHVNRAVIGIPDSLPPDVAVLDVRRRGQHVRAVPAKPLVIGLDVRLDAPREVLVQGRGLDAELGGQLLIRGTTDAPDVSGEGFDLVRGTFSLAGTTLTFDPSSHVSFDGAGLKKSIDPTLDFTATSTVQATTQVRLRISGYADAPKFEFSSPTTPGLGPDEIMALLLFGQPAAQLTALQAAELGAALASLTGVGGSGASPLTKIQKSLGLDRLSVGSNTVATATGGTENSGAAIQAGRYITRRVYVEGRQTTTGNSQVQVDVDMTKHLKLTTRLGNGAAIQGTTPDNDPGSSIGLSYQIEY